MCWYRRWTIWITETPNHPSQNSDFLITKLPAFWWPCSVDFFSVFSLYIQKQHENNRIPARRVEATISEIKIFLFRSWRWTTFNSATPDLKIRADSMSLSFDWKPKLQKEKTDLFSNLLKEVNVVLFSYIFLESIIMSAIKWVMKTLKKQIVLSRSVQKSEVGK